MTRKVILRSWSRKHKGRRQYQFSHMSKRDGDHEEERGVCIYVAVLDGVGCNNHDHLPVSADAPCAYCSKLVSVTNKKHSCNSTFQHRDYLTLDHNRIVEYGYELGGSARVN